MIMQFQEKIDADAVLSVYASRNGTIRRPSRPRLTHIFIDTVDEKMEMLKRLYMVCYL